MSDKDSGCGRGRYWLASLQALVGFSVAAATSSNVQAEQRHQLAQSNVPSVTSAERAVTAAPGATDCVPAPKPPSKPQPPRPSGPCCLPQVILCGTPGPGTDGQGTQGTGRPDDRVLKAMEQTLAAVKENTERTIDAAKTSNETIKWVFVVQSALAGFVGLVLASLGGLLTFLGFRSLKDFQRFQVRARKRRELIRRRFLEETKRMESWGEINTQFTAANAPLATLAAIRDEEVHDEIERAMGKSASDELSRAQRESRKLQAFANALRAIGRLKEIVGIPELAGSEEIARVRSWAEAAEAAVYLNAGKLDEALRLAIRAKQDNPKNHPDRAYWLGYVYARMYYERKDPALKEAAIREMRETFSQDATFAERAKVDKELELYLGAQAVAEMTKTT